MEINLFDNYIRTISDALVNGNLRKTANTTDSFSTLNENSVNSKQTKSKFFSELSQEKDLEMFNSLNQLNILNSGKTKYHEKLGFHPDFGHIKTQNLSENHYIISMFIDIKNSTGLFKSYYPDTVAYITTTIQRAAIHTCWYFDGYVQRLHGDGLLVYFGNKNTSKEQASKNALNAASIFSYFVKNDLKKLFDEQNVRNISTRIGIDLGNDDDVFWHLAGIGECSEITTCSLHTSLAFKMQASASTNGMIVGDNIISNLPKNLNHLFEKKKYKTEDGEDEYIFEITETNFKYRQWSFDWISYLKHMKNLEEKDGKLLIKQSSLFTAPTNPVVPKNLNNLQNLASTNMPWRMK